VLPILAKYPEPLPTILFVLFGCLAIVMLFKIGPKREPESMQDRIEQTVISMVGDRSSYIVDVQAKV